MSDESFTPAMVLDFDGTIRYAKEGQQQINEPEHVRIYDSVPEKLTDHRENGRLILGLTNQGGVAYGHKNPQGFKREVRRMKELFENQGYQWPFHDWYAAYNMEGGTVDKFDHRSLRRKPEIGGLALLAERVNRSYNLFPNWDESIFVGDREVDFECAKRAGMRFLSGEDFRSMAPEQHVQAAIDPTDYQSSPV